MAGDFFQFKKFVVYQDKCAMKVCTDSCLLGALVASEISLNAPDINTALDVGAGTGLLSLMVAQKVNVNFEAVEIEDNAAGQMQQNFLRSPWSARLKVLHTDARKLDCNKKYDLIISNPPFYENELKSNKKEITLARHDAGMLLSELALVLRNHLEECGLFYIMIPAFRYDYIMNQLSAHFLKVTKVVTLSHSTHHRPFRMILSGSKKLTRSAPVRRSICIFEGENYSEAFKQLLDDYYLQL